jgi:hypothetical protein
MFKVADEIDISGTFLLGYIKLSPSGLQSAFGRPHLGDGFKTTGEYAFFGPNGTYYTLYDWRLSLDIWGKSDPVEFHIGGDRNSQKHLLEFATWLKKQTDPDHIPRILPPQECD